MTIQEKAKKAWHQHLGEVEVEERELAAEELEKRRETAREAATAFEKWYGGADKVEATTYYEVADVYHDDLHLQIYLDDPDVPWLTLFGTCPECGIDVESNSFTTLWELGRLLEEGFVAADWHVKEEHGEE